MMFWCLINVLIFTCLISMSRQQELLAFENCDVISCPLDCNVTFVEGEECPQCSCPMGQRCPLLSCPPAPKCTNIQRLDGCLTCSCSLATYELFDQPKNLLIVTTTLSDIPGGTETCNLYDTQSVQRCMKPMLNFMKLAELRNANVIVQPMYSMFLYRQEQITEMCENYNQSLRCISTDTFLRCKNKERHLHMMMSMFKSICEGMNDQFMKQYDCIHNVLISHYQVDVCSKILSRTIDKASKGPFVMQIKRQRKCDSLNDFISCVSPVLKLFCGRNSSEIFKTSLLQAGETIAPECSVNDKNGFQPKSVIEVTLPSTILFTQPSTATTQTAATATSSSQTSLTSSSLSTASLTSPSTTLLTSSTSSSLSTAALTSTSTTLLTSSSQTSLTSSSSTTSLTSSSTVSASILTTKLTDPFKNPVIITGAAPLRDPLPPQLETSQLFRRRCDFIPPRPSCPNGTKPQSVARWFKRSGALVCQTYQYMYCGIELESLDRSIKYKEECNDLCFNDDEKLSRKLGRI